MEQLHHLLHISQSQSESFHIVLVSSRHPIELLKDTLELVLWNTYSIILNADAEVGVLIPRGHLKMYGNILTPVLHCIVKQVIYNVSEMHLVHIYERIEGIKARIDGASCVGHLQRECLHDDLNLLVGIQFLQFECNIVSVKQAHLKHLLHLQTQTFCLIVYHTAQAVVSGLTLGHLLVHQHLCCDGNGREGRLELMCHVVNEIILHLTHLLLTHHQINRNKESQKQDKGKEHGWCHISCHTQDV